MNDLRLWMFQIVTVVLLLSLGSGSYAQVKVAAFGDSLMDGYDLKEEEGFVSVLQQYLDSEGYQASVIDYATSGDTTTDGLIRVAELEKAKPEIVLLGLGSNDALRNSSVRKAKENLDEIIVRLHANGSKILLFGAMAPFNYGPVYKKQFDGIFPELADEHDLEFYPFILDGVALDPRYVLPDGLHPNPTGVKVMVERIGPSVAKLIDQFLQ